MDFNLALFEMSHSEILQLVFVSFLFISDSFLRSREKNDHEVTAMMKAQFMSLWDGETSHCFRTNYAHQNQEML